MKLRLITPLCAVLALAACDNSTDEELSDEALSLEDVAAEAATSPEMMLQPGEYRVTSELIEFTSENLPADVAAKAGQAFAEGAASGHTQCITSEMTAADWISGMNESACTVSSFEQDGSTMNAVLQCNDAEGMNGRVEMNGSASGTSSQMEARFNVEIPQMGQGSVHMRISSQRTGDCG